MRRTLYEVVSVGPAYSQATLQVRLCSSTEDQLFVMVEVMDELGRPARRLLLDVSGDVRRALRAVQSKPRSRT